MDTLHVYFLSDKDLGGTVTLEPKIPDMTMSGEDESIPRICCATTVLACLYSLGWHGDLKGNKKVWVYEADVPCKKLYQPTPEELPDGWVTGELWIMEPQEFELFAQYNYHRQMVLSNLVPYSRYCFIREGEDEIVDRVTATAVYGDLSAFSFIAEDSKRIKGILNSHDAIREIENTYAVLNNVPMSDRSWT